MGRVRIIRRQKQGYIEIPSDLLGNDEVELCQLKDGYYLLSIPIGEAAKAARKEGSINETERAVLKKLLSIRFEKRVPAYVNKIFGDHEKEVLQELERKKLINVFKGKKYREGVYNINDRAYAMLKKGGSQQRASEIPSQPRVSGSRGILMNQGFLIINDREEARALSEVLNQDMKQGQVFGVKGFDGKFYVVTRDYLVRCQNSINLVLKEDMDLNAIASAAKLDREGCRAVLQLMSDRGEIIEKRKGVFAPV